MCETIVARFNSTTLAQMYKIIRNLISYIILFRIIMRVHEQPLTPVAERAGAIINRHGGDPAFCRRRRKVQRDGVNRTREENLCVISSAVRAAQYPRFDGCCVWRHRGVVVLHTFILLLLHPREWRSRKSRKKEKLTRKPRAGEKIAAGMEKKASREKNWTS